MVGVLGTSAKTTIGLAKFDHRLAPNFHTKGTSVLGGSSLGE
jgi:hypothetical protein